MVCCVASEYLIMAWRATLSQAFMLKRGPSPIVSRRLHTASLAVIPYQFTALSLEHKQLARCKGGTQQGGQAAMLRTG